jgi:L-fuconolactonase
MPAQPRWLDLGPYQEPAMIIDTHVHVVADDNATFPQAPGAPAWPVTTVENLLGQMSSAGIDRALLVQTYFTYGYDNRYMTLSAMAHRDRFRSVCVLDPLSRDSPDQLTDLVLNRGVRGIRLMNDRAKNVVSIDDPTTFPLWERIEALGVPVCIAALISDTARIQIPAGRFPRVTIALDHIWGLKFDRHFDMLQPLFALAHFPNVYVKIAPNNSFAAREAEADVHMFYQSIIGRFGVQRVMWGSNYPAHSPVYGDLKARIELCRRDLSFLTSAEQEWVLGKTALSLWPELGRARLEI